MTTSDILHAAKAARNTLVNCESEVKNNVIYKMAKRLEEATEAILAANYVDIESARGNVSDVMLDRLALSKARIRAMADGMRTVAELPDPAWSIISKEVRPNGIIIEKTLVPMGVIAIIYESRPNVTSDAAVLAFKSGNACVLRSGKEAWNSANAITQALRSGLKDCGLPVELISLVTDNTRESARELMTASGLVDLLIPRGGAGLIRACVENATVPCIETGTGICHIYVEKTAKTDMALDIIENAKTSRPSVCNAAEVCLIDADIAEILLPKLKKRLVDDRKAAGLVPVELRLDARSAAIISGTPAGDKDFDTEFLDYILAVRIVDSVHDACVHIAKHSTGHSDAIVTESNDARDYFLKNVDSAAVYVNASTRFTDGGEFGLGCEMGISTQKLHARGPMGLKELMTYKYIIKGTGQIR